MITFVRSINRLSDLLSVLWKDGNIFIFINIGLIIGNPKVYCENAIVIESIIILIFIALLSRKRNRIINRLGLDDETKKIELEYYHFFKSVKVMIPYSQINYAYRDKMFGRFTVRKTLEFFNGDSLVAEVRERNDFGWKDNTIKAIFEKLKTIKDERSN
jgi:hypothetical protein